MPDYGQILQFQSPNDIKGYIQKVFSDIGKSIDITKMQFEYQAMGHEKPKFEKNHMYIYSFWFDKEEVPLKIGKAGPKTKQRYIYQHYRRSKKGSCLANSIAKDQTFCEKYHVNTDAQLLQEWIRANCHRLNIKMPLDPKAGYDMFTLELIEAVLHNVYTPKYEGF